MKNHVLKGAGMAALLLAAILGCQTAKPVLVAPAQSAVEVEKAGFSPAGAAEHNSIEISLLFGNGEAIKSWKVEVGSGGRKRSSSETRESVFPSFVDPPEVASESTRSAESSHSRAVRSAAGQAARAASRRSAPDRGGGVFPSLIIPSPRGRSPV